MGGEGALRRAGLRSCGSAIAPSVPQPAERCCGAARRCNRTAPIARLGYSSHVLRVRVGIGRCCLRGGGRSLPGSAIAAGDSLYQGPGPRPGPNILYSAPATAPQLENAGDWHAKPILISGASAYRQGEFLYQDYLYDDHGAQGASRDPGDPRTSNDSFSLPNGTYTYPTNPAYANNAADLVELRVKPVPSATNFRITLNSLTDPSLVATTIAIGSSPQPRAFPYGANATAPAQFFLTVHGDHADLRRRRHRPARDSGATGLDLAAAPPDPGARPASGMEPRRANRSPRRWGRALEQVGQPVPRARAPPPTRLTRAAPPGSPAPPPSSTPPFASTSPGSTSSRPPPCSATPPGGATARRAPPSPRATSARFTRTSTSPSSRLASRTTCTASPRACRPAARWTASSPATSRPSRAPTTRPPAAAPPTARASCAAASSRTRSTCPRSPRLRAATASPCSCTHSAPATTSSPTTETNPSSASVARDRS